MRYFRGTITLFLLLSFLGLCLIGCTETIPNKEDVKGNWVAIRKEAFTLGSGDQLGFVMEIIGDNTVLLPSGKGKWTLLNDGRLKIEMPNMTMIGSLNGDILTITMPDEQGKVIFKKQ